MNELSTQSPLQRALTRVLMMAPKPRDYYDRIIQSKTGTTGKPIYDIQRGKSKKPSHDVLKHIATALEIPLSYLTEPVEAHLEPDIPLTKENIERDNTVYLRQVDLTYSMGPGSTIEDYPEEGLIPFDANLVRSITRSPPERLFVARGGGDSMFPTLINDDMVVIDTGQRQLNAQDRIWAISLHGAGGIKRLRAIGKNRIMVISDNPTVDNQEADSEDMFIAGRVIWIGRRV